MSRIKKGDIFVVVFVLLIALAGLAILSPRPGSGENLSAEIYIGGRLIQTVPLTGEQQELPLQSDSGYNLLALGSQGVKMLFADCLNQDCVKAGLIDRPGAALACLPHRLLVRICGPKAGDYDGISK